MSIITQNFVRYDLWDIDVDSLDEVSLVGTLSMHSYRHYFCAHSLCVFLCPQMQNFGVSREELRQIQIKNREILRVKAEAMPTDEKGIDKYALFCFL